MERTEHDALARYLASDGAAAARDALRQRPYWNIADDSNDGRRSVDMLDLIERMRVLRAKGRDVAIAPYDIPPSGYAGNVHAMLQPLVLPGIGTGIEPMAYRLRELQPYSIKISASTGEIWGCRSGHGCGPHPHLDQGKSGPWLGAIGQYHYRSMIPAFSAARLGRAAGRERP